MLDARLEHVLAFCGMDKVMVLYETQLKRPACLRFFVAFQKVRHIFIEKELAKKRLLFLALLASWWLKKSPNPSGKHDFRKDWGLNGVGEVI